MDLRKVADDVAKVWGYLDFENVPPFGQERIRLDINAAIQLMADCGEDFYGRENIVLDLTSGSGSYELPLNIQSVLEPVTLSDGSPVRKLTSFGQVLQYNAIFRGAVSGSLAAGKPEAYFVHSLKSGDDDDNVRTVIQFLPAPSAGQLGNKPVIPVIREPTIYTTHQLTAGTSSLPIPHKYVESIFLPIARWNATTCFLFTDKDKVEKYKADYDRALEQLGISDPRQRPRHPESNSETVKPKGGGNQ